MPRLLLSTGAECCFHTALSFRHCEERSDEAISSGAEGWTGLLRRFAPRNDGKGLMFGSLDRHVVNRGLL